jgi:hypothetical protein
LISLNWEEMIVYSEIARASKAIITKFIVNLRFLMAGGVDLSFIATYRAFLDLILFLKASAF